MVYWIDSMYKSGSSAGEQYTYSIVNGCFQEFSCEHRIGEGGATKGASAETQSTERPR
jgi:hypothetical protein